MKYKYKKEDLTESDTNYNLGITDVVAAIEGYKDYLKSEESKKLLTGLIYDINLLKTDAYIKEGK